jgi:transposase
MKIQNTVRLVLTTPLSDREIADAVGVSKTTVGRYRRLAAAKQFVWADLAQLRPTELAKRFNRDPNGNKTRKAPDFAEIQQRLDEGHTLQVLWEDYRREDPHHTLSYSQLAARMRRYRKTLPTGMRMSHEAGFKAYVDFAGFKRIPLPTYLDPTTGKPVAVQVFVATLPASSLIFAKCVPSQKVPDFIQAHVDMLAYFGGAPLTIVCDNLKSAVVHAGKQFVLQASYKEFARYHRIAINPARPFRPKDKAAVETSVGIVQDHIVARLHQRTHHSIEELNASLAELLDELNRRPMTEYRRSRWERFEASERQALQPLPAEPFVYAKWVAIPRVPKDYHVRVDHHHYSVPHELTGQRLTARLTADRVEIFKETEQVTSHARSFERGGHTTDPAHLTDDHRAWSERTPEHMVAWAKKAGPQVAQFVRNHIGKSHPLAALPACDEVKALAEKHGTLALNQAAGEALHLNTVSLGTLRRILSKQSQANAPAKITRPRHRYAQGSKAFARQVKEAAC